MPSRGKPWWKSKTLWVNAAVLGLAAVEANLRLLEPAIGVDIYRLLAFALPVVNAMLRFVTTEGLARR